MAVARDFVHDLGVGAAAVDQVVVGPELQRPARAGQRIALPIDGRSQMHAAEAQKLIGFAAVGNFPYSNSVNVNARLGHCLRDRIADTTGGVVILDSDDVPARCRAGSPQPGGVNP